MLRLSPAGRARPAFLAGLATGAVLLAAAPAGATTFDVTTTQDPAGACATPPSGCSLRQALAIVNATPSAPDVITLAPGTYLNQQALEFPITKSVSIVGAGSKTTTVTGSVGSRVFNATGPAADVSISGITITGGHAGASFGGGINATPGTLLSLSKVAIVGNDAKYGGGINSQASAARPLTITDSLIANNTAGTFGGGGLYFDINGAAGTLRNVTVTGNVATGVSNGGLRGAGGISKLNGVVNLIDSTVAGNSATGPDGVGNLSGAFSARDTIVANGSSAVAGRQNCFTAGDGTPTPNTSLGYNLEDRDQCFPTKSTGDVVATNPMLGTLAAAPDASSTLALLPGSPAINTGNPGLCDDVGLLHDQRQLPRPQGRCDVGAFEFQLPTFGGTPAVSGSPAVGSTLTCTSPAASSVDGPATAAVSWLRDGAAVAAGDTYATTAADVGRAVACRTTVTNAAGAVDATSPALTVTSTPVTGPGPGPVPGPGPGPGPDPGTPKPAVVAKAPKLTLTPRTRTLRTILGSGGLLVSTRCDQACGVRITVEYGKKTVATGTRSVAAGKATLVRVKVTKAGKKALRGRTRVRLKVTVVATSGTKATTKTVSFTTAKPGRGWAR